ncbi:MAG: type VI secretion system tip protein TssI/VgrG, partial [bacterium]
MASYTQVGKPMRATSPLGADVLLLDRLSGSEAMSQPFVLTLDFLSLDGGIDPNALLKKPIGVTIDLPDKGKRYFHGWVRRFVQLGRDADKLVAYQAEVVPWLWFLSLSTRCQIWQAKNVPDIVKGVFGKLGMTDFRLSLTGSYPVRDYCVQYRETDLDFVSRLLEEEGIYYYFEHTADKHTLVLADTPNGLLTGPVATLSAASSEAGKFGDQFITTFEITNEYVSGKVHLGDYNFETPSSSLSPQTTTTVTGLNNSSFEVYDYPGKFSTAADGDRISRLRMEEREAPNAVVRGQAKCGGLVSGAKLEVADYYRRDANKSYQLVSVEHSLVNSGYRTADIARAADFDASFVAIPSTVPYRPPRVTPKAVVRGVQTAVVVGPGGEEIYVDKYGP